MRNPQRIDRIVELLRRRWKQTPDWRLGQLIVNVTGRSDPFYIEDDTIEELLRPELRSTDE